jgi:ElaB/YqjD/DUF883 family membrane-anchored ribosome-binding protein
MTSQTNSRHAAPRQAEQIIGHAQQSAREALDDGADLARDAATAGAAAVGKAADHVDTAVRSGLRAARSRAHDASEDTADYVRERPFQSMLVALVAGAAVMTIIGLLGRPRKAG